MKGAPFAFLLVVVLPALLSACSSVFSTQPGFGSFAKIDIVEIAPGKPAVTVQTVRREGAGTEHGPFSGSFYVRPGYYQAFATCNRPAPDGKEVVVKIGTADAKGFNFGFPVASGTYMLDCTYGKEGLLFVMTGDKLLYNE